ncbi:MAG: NYN domain-containing protein [Acidimicrobiia bacterium]
MNADERQALLPMVSVARDVLADLDEDDVPPRVMRVAKSAARRLPPPLEQSLIDYIVDDAPFRATVDTAWAEGGASDSVVEAFLEDPDQAAPMLAAASVAADADRRERDVERLEAMVQQLEAKQEQAKDRLAAVRDHAQRQATDAKASAKRARLGLESSLAQARADDAAANEALGVARDQISMLEAEVEDLKVRLKRLSERETKRHVPTATQTTQTSIPAGEPLDIARWLDVAERTLRPYRETSTGLEPNASGGGLLLPPGVAPDRPESVEALAGMPVEAVILDGYNIASVLGVDDFAGAEGRERTLRVARKLHRYISGSTIVMFDAVGIEGRESYIADLGIEVRFTRDVSADDAIVNLLGSGISGAVVITNDRELRERIAMRGALALWSDALVAWSKT